MAPALLGVPAAIRRADVAAALATEHRCDAAGRPADCGATPPNCGCSTEGLRRAAVGRAPATGASHTARATGTTIASATIPAAIRMPDDIRRRLDGAAPRGARTPVQVLREPSHIKR